MNTSITRFLLLSLSLLVVGCSGMNDDLDPTKGWSASKIYNEAKSQMLDGNYEQAAKLYESLQTRYPYGVYSQQAELEQIYSYYKQGEKASAISEADRFIKAHPNHPGVDYAYYMKGLANFDDDLGLFGVYSPEDLAQRDSKPYRDAFETFKELVTRFPKSKYTPDAIVRMRYIVNALAKGDIVMARYYYKRQAYLAAADRAKEVLIDYSKSPQTEEALYILAKSYQAMNLTQLSNDALRVLKRDFPESKFLQNKPSINRPWWKKII
ncbi:outer membrane protein assembly factor BamD [Ferrovum sp. PN-J185]|uniref:outer membrane protein assembly factor BamD n=1 Tax=Ferrovum sp. PN-J185 TaxID=1356306 RepID=UPI0008347413|nr:outer membrane protein assembly factor BamD [Ferrovum sp. PN-J185]MCC6069055.1 outer membrane protein assembly factor BamD [Ferrovum sp. PN-J185]MDE1890965.1 outer membrane protein assembly factor BamD [Betaproteobacteria bacterium]MDE2055723.1 outer membrane protein assembly factor BamD [Betaproteobacteria bacterium]